ncbi:hypothetical protein ACFPH6_36920 [Streptomyces xiangluensis]|uniref:Uncharacterized protein n=1 Tax=Streptomyces xiangluensis TaxID=2665720 RepID=A0ABV8Z1J4_9ACTN
MDLDALRHGNFSKLGEAITDWEQMTKKLTDLQKDAETNLKPKADKAKWAGVNATVSREFITKTAAEFADAHTQADSITKILKDTRGELISYRTQLTDAIERGVKKNLTVMDTGNGTFTVTMNIHPDRAVKGTHVPEHTQQDVDNFRDEIQRILTKATESDSSAADVLRLLVDQAKHGFSDANYKDRDSAAKAVAAAEELAKILKKDPSEVTNTELASLNSTLATYKNDPLFAEKFATDLGPKRTMQFYSDLANDSQFYVNPRSREGLSDAQKERMKLIGGFEKQLGMTLATASHSDSDDMQKWKNSVITEGGTNFRATGQSPVYGFQVMSNLMRNGEYKTDFLHDYGDALIDYEKKHTSDEYGGLQRRTTREDVLPWDRSAQYERLHYGAGNDAGGDPMTGFMEALGHNADASTDFFNEGKNFDYLTEDREWPKDFTSSDAKTLAGYDSLGHALESATKGAPYDADPPQLHRDAETAAVAEKVVQRYGQDAEYKDDKQTGLSGAQLQAKQQGIGDSLGSIGAAYIDDINWAMDGNADKSLFAMDNGERSSVADRAHFNTGDLSVTKFLSTVGQDPDGYAQITTAQQAYTTSLVNEYPPSIQSDGDVDSTRAETAIRTGAELQGITDRSRAEEVRVGQEEADKKYNDAIDARAEQHKMIAGLATGGLFSMAPEPSTGYAATVVPIVGEGVEGVVGGMIEKNIDEYAESQHRDNSEQGHTETNKVYDKGYHASWQPGYSVLTDANKSDAWSTDQYQYLSQELRTAHQLGYTSGSQMQQNVGSLPTPDGN